MKKTLICSLPNLKEKPLSILDTELTVDFKDETWDGHAFGIRIGYIDEDGETVSLIRQDTEAGNTELLDKMREDYSLIEKKNTVMLDGMKLVNRVSYYVPYTVKGHTSALPTVTDTFVDSITNVSYDVAYEALFTAGEGYLHYFTLDYRTEGPFSASFWDQVEDLEDQIEEWVDEESQGFRQDGDGFALPFYDGTGEKCHIYFNSVSEFMRGLASIRVTKCTEAIQEPGGKAEEN